MATVNGPWYCDTCGDPIVDIANGYVIWKAGRDEPDHGFKIIHQARCDQDGHAMSLALEDFLGVDGLVMVLSFISIGPLKLDGELTGNSRRVASTDEFVDLVRRVQVPGYEEARRRFRDDDVRERFSDANEYMPYLQQFLASINAGD